MLDYLDPSTICGKYFQQPADSVSDANAPSKSNIPLEHILNTCDFARKAMSRLSKEAWDYLVSVAADEVTNREKKDHSTAFGFALGCWLMSRVQLTRPSLYLEETRECPSSFPRQLWAGYTTQTVK
jgi:hypothetical protein